MPLPEIEPGHWYRVPNSRMRAQANIVPSPLPPGASGYGGILAESSMIFDTKRRRVVIWGGGHGDYAGNELPAFYIDDQRWERIWGPTPNELINDLNAPASERERYKDGNPASRHTRDGLEYLPTQDSLFSHGGSLWSGSGGNSRQTWWWMFDMDHWTQRAGAPDTEFTNVYCAYDKNTDTVLVVRPLTLGTRTLLYRYTPSPESWQQLSSSAFFDNRRTCAYDHKRKKLLMGGMGQIVVWDLNQPSQPAVVKRTGLTGVLSRPGWGIEYDDALDCYVAWPQGSTVYFIDPETFDPIAQQLPAGSAVPPDTHGGGNTGVHGRFRRDPQSGYYVVVNHVDDDVFFFRPKSQEGSMPYDVKVNLPVAPQSGFPEGTIGGPYRYKLLDGPDQRSQDVNATTFTFQSVQPGRYRASGQRYSTTGQPLGTERFSPPFDVSADVTVTIDVVTEGVTVEVIKR